MRGYRKVLIAVNGSKHVLDQGLRLANDEKTWVTIVKVIPLNEGELDLTGIKNIEDALDSGGKKALAEYKKTAESERTLVKMRLEEGAAHEKIVEVAGEENCDLIIMGTPKIKHRLTKFFGDRTVEKVIHRSPCPVLVVGA
ncbi:MAG: universal stress protein [Nitrospirae bacterium]|nr:MAG: universal stress protein [Nitrospirota bacterium]